MAGAVQAQDRQAFDLPAQPLDQSITQFARQAGVQIFFAAPLAEGRRAPALKGSYTAREALEQILAGSGLVPKVQDERTYTLEPAADGAVLPAVRVRASGEGESPTGVVGGYVARRSATATKTDTALDRTPQSVSVVSAEAIADQNALSVAEALRYSSGVFTEYRGASNLHDELVLRGFQYAPRYLNGLLYGGGSLGQVDPYLVERVELLRGPSSVLYGQASPGGIVNLVSKQPDPAARQEVVAGFGNRNRASLAADLGGSLGDDERVTWRLAASAEKVGLQEDHLRQERVAVSPSLTWAIDAQTELRVQAVLQHEPEAGFRNFMEAAGVLEPTTYGYIPRSFLVSDPSYDRSTRDQYSLGYQFSHRFDDSLRVRQNLRVNRIDSDYRTLIWGALQADEETISRVASGGSEDLRQAQVDNQLQYDVTAGGMAHKVLAGLDLRDTRRNYQWGMNTTVPSINWRDPVYGVVSDVALTAYPSQSTTRSRQAGLYVQDQIEFGPWSLLGGLRQDWARTTLDDQIAGARQTVRDHAATGRLGAVYALAGGISPYASYSTSFEPVLDDPGAGNPMFQPMRAQQVELGVKVSPKDSQQSYSVAVYDLRQQNVLTYDPVTNAAFQTGEVRVKGAELEARTEVMRQLSLIASYSVTDAEVSRSLDADAVGKAPARIPKQQGSVWARYEQRSGPLAGVGVGLGVRRVGASQGDAANTFEVPGVTLLDASLTIDFAEWSRSLAGFKLQFNAANLEDKRHVASCASRWACFYGNGRVLTGSLRYAW